MQPTSIAAGRPTTDELYWEARGAGTAVLLIAGSPGDGGQFETVAQRLAENHLVITYDRRGTSRSAHLPQRDAMSGADHAPDAANVLSAIGVDRAVAFGTSNGAALALELALRHPRRLATLTSKHWPPTKPPQPCSSARLRG